MPRVHRTACSDMNATSDTRCDGSLDQSDFDLDDDRRTETNVVRSGRVCLSQRVLRESTMALRLRIQEIFQKHYNQEPKELQIGVVQLLVRGHDVFFHAGTGFGKTRIAETFLWLHGKRNKALYLVLNPMDALGDNQVCKLLWQLNCLRFGQSGN